MNYDNLWICFPFSKLRVSRENPTQPGLILLMTEYRPKGRSIASQILKIPAVDRYANIKYIEILNIDVEFSIDKLCKQLNLPIPQEFFNSVRYPIFVVKGEYEYSICYTATALKEDRNNIINLGLDVERCLEANLAQLDDCERKPNWRDGFINPLLDQVALKVALIGADMSMYEIIGKLPLLRKKFGFYRNGENSDKLGFGSYYKRVNGFKVGLRRTATSEDEARRIASEMLAGKEGFESVVIQNLQDPQRGAIEFWIEEGSTIGINHK